MLARTALLLGLLTLAAVPTATAEGCTAVPGLAVCTIEGNATWGDCDTVGYDHHFTHVIVYSTVGNAGVTGYDNCTSTTSYRSSASGFNAGATTVVGGGGVAWYEYEETWGGSTASGCHTVVSLPFAGYRDLGCPAGAPPALPWGNLVP